MFGAQYATRPDLLMDSLYQMNKRYKTKFRNFSPLQKTLASLYIKIFGIPEVGFQIRGLYFRKSINRLTGFNPTSILDIGSGIGCYSFFLSEAYAQSKVTGWDIDHKKIKNAKELGRAFNRANVEFAYGDIVKKTTGKNEYDFILIIDVLEHIENYKKALKNIYRLLKPGGYLYIHVPQVHQKRFFKDLAGWEHEDHKREGFHPDKLPKELTSMGFKVIAREHSFGLVGKFAWELGHITLMKHQILAALCYPFLYGLSKLDSLMSNKNGLCMAILARKS
jgi:2-polyprenyl-3-methyl-5-hydroxy-6-metoxy-1,4-benzoquinol methylase